MRRAAATDTATEARRMFGPEPGRGPDPPRVPWCRRGDDTFKDAPRASDLLQTSLKEPSVSTVGFTLVGRGLEEEPEQQLAWQRRAPQGRAPSGWAGKRRAPGSWTRLANSLEETKRRGARGLSGVTWPLHPSNPPLAVGPMKTLWCISSGALFPLLVLNPGLRHRVPRAQSRRSGDAETKAHCPGSSTCDALIRSQETPSPVLPLNAGAPSSKLEDPTTDPSMGPGEEEKQEGEGKTDLHVADSQPQEALTH
ncbi:uncharacterized protein mbpa isoform X2 [Acanthochromis polyacanthus]|uniref:uncharacterized protein mbpa isoform X2 n=1 Tax=Acanthochromis polyacanthus TaxID=80966 RepID=UPI0022347861|nr:uncharacterized protein mbpa isoform X2 [Acanthochromis polyacanthus]